jgi:hypothetical protein
VSADDLEVARQLLETLAVSAATGEREALYLLLARDVEWSAPQRDLRGLVVGPEQVGSGDGWLVAEG